MKYAVRTSGTIVDVQWRHLRRSCSPAVNAQRLAEEERDAALRRAEEAEAERDALRKDRIDALKRANELTLDTQSVAEAVQALVDLVRTARASRDDYRAAMLDAVACADGVIDGIRNGAGGTREQRIEQVIRPIRSALSAQPSETRATSEEKKP